MHIGSSTGVYSNAVTLGVGEPKVAPDKSSVAIEEQSFSPIKESAETDSKQALQSQNKQTKEEAQEQEQQQQETENKRIEEQQQRQQLREQEVIRELAGRDREVRAHEQAHSSVGGQYAGGPSFQYKRGPNGVSYAVSGEVGIDLSPIAGDPQATLQKELTVVRAALAPADPSSQDRLVAAKASQIAVEARAEISRQRGEELNEEETQDADKSDETKESNESESENTKALKEQEKRQQELQEDELKRQEILKRRSRELNKTLTDLTIVDEPVSIGFLLDSVV